MHMVFWGSMGKSWICHSRGKMCSQGQWVDSKGTGNTGTWRISTNNQPLFQLHRKTTEFKTSTTAVLAEGITVHFGHGEQSLLLFFKQKWFLASHYKSSVKSKHTTPFVHPENYLWHYYLCDFLTSCFSLSLKNTKKSVKSVKKWGTNACSLVPQIWVTIRPLYKKSNSITKHTHIKHILWIISAYLKKLIIFQTWKHSLPISSLKATIEQSEVILKSLPFSYYLKMLLQYFNPSKEAIHTQSKSSGRVTDALSGQNKSIWVTNFCALDNLHPPQIAHGCICFNLSHWQYLGKFQRDTEIVTPTTTSVHYTSSFQFMERLCCLFHPWIVWPFSAMRNLYLLQ